MKRTAIFILALIVLAGLIFLIERGPGRSNSEVDVQFLGMTNDPDLGPAAIFLVTNQSGGTFAFSNEAVTTRTLQNGKAATAPLRWKIGSMTNLFGAEVSSIHETFFISSHIRSKAWVVVIVAAPPTKSAWRVNFTGWKPWPNWLVVLDQSTGGFLGRHVGRPGFSVESPEIKD